MTALKTRTETRMITYKKEVAFLRTSVLDTAITTLQTGLNK